MTPPTPIILAAFALAVIGGGLIARYYWHLPSTQRRVIQLAQRITAEIQALTGALKTVRVITEEASRGIDEFNAKWGEVAPTWGENPPLGDTKREGQ